MAEKTAAAAAAAAGAAAEEIADCDEQCYVDEEINEQMEDLILYPEESCPSFEVNAVSCREQGGHVHLRPTLS